MGVFGKTRDIRPERIDTVVGKDTKCTGTIELRGALRIDGEVEGEIRGEGDITIGEAAQVMANIQGRNVTIAGRVKGNVHARGKLELLPTACMDGDITTVNLVIASGAHFSGSSIMERKETASKADKVAAVAIPDSKS